MAIVKAFWGPESDLSSISGHQGYIYFCTDSYNVFVDITNDANDRVQINGRYAGGLQKNMGGGVFKRIDIDDILLKTMTATVAQGGTGRNSLNVNTVLIGNGTDEVKMVALNPGEFVLGDGTDGIKGIAITSGAIVVADSAQGAKGVRGTGVLQAKTAGNPEFDIVGVQLGGTGKTSFTKGQILVGDGTNPVDEVPGAVGVLHATTVNQPQFGVAPISVGGTGANNAADARDNLSVYSKTEVDNKVAAATSTFDSPTLLSSLWYANGSVWQYDYGNTSLVANQPPIINCLTNQDEYRYITKAEATAGVGITFTAKYRPMSDIKIGVIDVK